MAGQFVDEKSCDSQLLPESPQKDWGLDQLRQYAQAVSRAIATREQNLALEYWRLGEALSLARRHFAHGQWSKYLATLGIEKTQAAKACAIHRTFAGPKQVEGLSVDQAYRQRQRKQPRRRKQKSRRKHPAPKLASWLRGICQSADSFLADAVLVSGAESGSLIAAIDVAIEELGRLRARLESQVEENSSVISLADPAPTTRIDPEQGERRSSPIEAR